VARAILPHGLLFIDSEASQKHPRQFALETIGKKDGAVVGHGTYAVSEDRLVMTATIGATDAQGAAFEQVIVFDREAGD